MAEWCKKCGKYMFSGEQHCCPPKWLAWSEDDGGTEDHAATVYAVDSEVAALKWVEDYDCSDSGYPIAADGGSVVVCVRLSTEEEVRRFNVSGEFAPIYRAKEINE